MGNQEDTGVPPPGSARRVTDAWVRASGHLFDSLVEANRATLASLGFDDPTGAAGDASPVGSDEPRETSDEPPVAPAIAGDEPAAEGWSVDRSLRSLDHPSVGDTVRFTKPLTDEDVAAFARASGDTNPLHLDDAFAERTRFGGRIAHGTLVSGLVSAALARLPGLVIYLSQDVRFLNPVRPGTTLTAVVEVVEAEGEGRFRIATNVFDDEDRQVIEGEAVILVDSVGRAKRGPGPGPASGQESGPGPASGQESGPGPASGQESGPGPEAGPD